MTIAATTEEVLLDGAPTYKFFHNGGFSSLVTMTTGDGGGDASSTSQDLTNLLGVLMRLNDDGTVPADNPFTSQAGYNGVPCGQTTGMLPSDAPADAVCSEILPMDFVILSELS
jgi:Glucose / Sorbosone dehydrogenase